MREYDTKLAGVTFSNTGANGERRYFSVGILGKTARVENDPDGTATAALTELAAQALDCPEYLPKEPYRSKIPWQSKYQRAVEENCELDDILRRRTAFDTLRETADLESAAEEAHRRGAGSDRITELPNPIKMYVILEHESILGYENRPDRDFFEEYQDFFEIYDSEALLSLRNTVSHGRKDAYNRAYYDRLLTGSPLWSRFQTVVMSLFHHRLHSVDLADDARFALEHTRNWFSPEEQGSIEAWMEDYLRRLRSDIPKQLAALHRDWARFSSAKPYLHIVESDDEENKSETPFQIRSPEDDDCYSPFQNCRIELKTYGANRLSSRVNVGMAWSWGVSVSDIWTAAIQNMLLIQNFSRGNIDEYCRAAAKAIAKYGS